MRSTQRALLLGLAGASLLAACTTSHHSAPIPSHTSPTSTSTGSARFSYGSLSVAVPRGWILSTKPLENCFPPPPDTVTEARVSTVTASSCPNMASKSTAPYVTIQCLTGKANRLFSGGTGVVIRGHALYRSGNVMWLQGPNSEGVVIAGGSSALVQQLLSSVRPTGQGC